MNLQVRLGIIIKASTKKGYTGKLSDTQQHWTECRVATATEGINYLLFRTFNSYVSAFLTVNLISQSSKLLYIYVMTYIISS